MASLDDIKFTVQESELIKILKGMTDAIEHLSERVKSLEAKIEARERLAKRIARDYG